MAMALLNGLPDEFKSLISALDALDALDSDESELKWEHIETRVLQEEQRIAMRHQSAINKSESSALITKKDEQKQCSNCSTCAVSRKRPVCDHCGIPGHVRSKCWKKFPHLRPRNRRQPGNSSALITHQDDDPTKCLMTKYQVRQNRKNPAIGTLIQVAVII